MTVHLENGELYDPRKGDPAICIQALKFEGQPFEPTRTNCFSIYVINSGSGTLWADAASFTFGADSLVFFIPYQHIRFVPETKVLGKVILFHANFLCVETFHAEVGCAGILFNDPYGTPIVPLQKKSKLEIESLVQRLQREQIGNELASGEVMLALVKVLLILATRLKSSQATACGNGAMDLRNPVLTRLRDLIEENYATLHAPAEYAKRLHMTPQNLGRIVRENLGMTITELIRNRILIHAKWQLLHTLKPVKEISQEVGYKDELYFSRLFKKATGNSPTFFRDFETEIRGGSNLSMFSDDASILHSRSKTDT